MKLSISEMAARSGVSVRTLHYYDQIGLLRPAEVGPDNGYRYYDEADMTKLQQILFFRELDFPLKEIQRIMTAPGYSRSEALHKQKELLLLKRQRLDGIIGLLEDEMKGEERMSFNEFDTSEIDEIRNKYAEEAKARWGDTEAYKESAAKTAGRSKEEWQQVTGEMDELLKRFAEKRGTDPAGNEVQELVRRWQQHITDRYYNCTDEILAGLGQMYIADPRFRKNMDKYGEGTAELISRAIEIYCRK
jgi:DNA-binding transcriptional MerR regulator